MKKIKRIATIISAGSQSILSDLKETSVRCKCCLKNEKKKKKGQGM